MMGLFGAPGAMPLPGASPRKGKPSIDTERKPAGEPEATSVPAPAPPVPVMTLPGMNKPPPPAPPSDVQKEGEPRQAPQVTEQHGAEEVPDVEDVVHEEQFTERGPPPPLHGMD